MDGGSKTSMEILEIIRGIVKENIQGTSESQDFSARGLDDATIKGYIEIIEFCQQSAPRITAVGKDGDEESLLVQIGHGTPADLLRTIESFEESIDTLTEGGDTVDAISVPSGISRMRDRVLLTRELYEAIQGRRYKSVVIHDIPRKDTSLKMKCVECSKIIDAAYHCDEGPLQVNVTLKSLYCSYCGFLGSVPKHCGKHVAIVYYDDDGPIMTVAVADDIEEA